MEGLNFVKLCRRSMRERNIRKIRKASFSSSTSDDSSSAGPPTYQQFEIEQEFDKVCAMAYTSGALSVEEKFLAFVERTEDMVKSVVNYRDEIKDLKKEISDGKKKMDLQDRQIARLKQSLEIEKEIVMNVKAEKDEEIQDLNVRLKQFHMRHYHAKRLLTTAQQENKQLEKEKAEFEHHMEDVMSLLLLEDYSAVKDKLLNICTWLINETQEINSTINDSQATILTISDLINTSESSLASNQMENILNIKSLVEEVEETAEQAADSPSSLPECPPVFKRLFDEPTKDDLEGTNKVTMETISEYHSIEAGVGSAFKRKTPNRISSFFKNRTKKLRPVPEFQDITPKKSSIFTLLSGDKKDSPKQRDFPWTPKKFLTPCALLETPKSGIQRTEILINRSYSTPANYRLHSFRKKYISSMKQSCQGCSKSLFGQVASVCADCKSATHNQFICRGIANLPCVPSPIKFPKLSSNSKYVLADYIHEKIKRPMVPGIIVQCTNEIERRGFLRQGLYRVCGKKSEVDKILGDFFSGRGLPNLSGVDIDVLTSTVKTFLGRLNEPLLTTSKITDFINATQNKDYLGGTFPAVCQAVADLPQPNRDTLAWMITHLQRVALCDETSMDVSNLAIVFAPTLVGLHLLEPYTVNVREGSDLQIKVMKVLLEIATDYWESFCRNHNADRTF